MNITVRRTQKCLVAACLGLLLCFAFGVHVHAVELTPSSINKVCPAGSKEYGVWSKGGAKDTIKQIIQKNGGSACSDDRISVHSKGYICLETLRACKAGDEKKYGCETGKIPPKFYVVLPPGVGSGTLVFNKCDKRGLTGAVDTSFDAGNAEALQELAHQHENDLKIAITAGPSARELLSKAPIIPLDISTDTGKQQLAEQLRNMGVGDPDRIVASNPERALEMLRAIADGDKTKAERIAGELQLNDDVISNVGKITDEVSQEAKSVTPSYEPDAPPSPASTFSQQPQNAPTDMDRAKYAVCRIESGCNYYKYGPVTRTGDRAYGKYQVMGRNVVRWTCEVGQCMTPQQFMGSPEMQERVFEHKFGQYVAQYGYNGAARAWFAGPGCVLRWCGGDQLGTSVNGYTAKFSAYFNGTIPPPSSYNKYTANPVASAFSTYAPEPFAAPSSPFAVGNPYASSAATQQQMFSQPQTQTPSYAPLQSQQGGAPGVSGAGGFPAQTGVGQAGGGAALPIQRYKPIISIVAEPKKVSKGKPILVSWTSVGTIFQTACEVLRRESGRATRISEDKEGSKIISTGSLATGTHTFIFQCKTQGGETITKETQVIIE